MAVKCLNVQRLDVSHLAMFSAQRTGAAPILCSDPSSRRPRVTQPVQENNPGKASKHSIPQVNSI
jgi:hypothetical protein